LAFCHKYGSANYLHFRFAGLEEVEKNVPMKLVLAALFFLLSFSSFCQLEYLLKDSIRIQKEKIGNLTIKQYLTSISADTLQSKSNGIVSKGSLNNGKLIPFYGDNFEYFDSISYMSNRAFVNDRVRSTILAAYGLLKKDYPKRKFYIMECSREHGGEMFPHKTHQNGLSVDFMTPLVKDGKAFTDLDTLGADRYWLNFDNQGRYVMDSSISIDFETVALHIIRLNQVAKKFNLQVAKVIIKIELKDELFSGLNGQKLKASGIYFVQKLSPIINSLHDDHFHVDFEKI
jgi:penicillin-insensitive murein endopeptidase